MNSQLHVFSIISKNYLAHLRVMSDSLRKSRSNLVHHVLLLDDSAGYISSEDEKRFSFYAVEDLCSADKIFELYSKYSCFELSCIFKSKFAKHLFGKKRIESAFYLDADLYFLTNFIEAEKLLESSNCVLTPHQVQPSKPVLPEQVFAEAALFSAGTFNMGFFGLRNSKETMKFLDWWDVRTEANCRRDVGRGFFDDQAWIDPAFVLFDGFKIIKNPAYNVANWNLNERLVEHKANKYFSNGEPLVFFHFSQANIRQDKFLTSYKTILLDSCPAIRELYFEYKELLLKADFESVFKWPFSKSLEVSSFKFGSN